MRSRRRSPRRKTTVLLAIALLGSTYATVSCLPPAIPDQAGFAPLADLATTGQAVARLYSAPIPNIEAIATHAWFVVKSAEATSFDRWELWQTAGGPYGHLRRNLQAPESGVGANGAFVVAELIGPAAEPVVDFITDRSPTYPCRNTYFFLGPNSNTYAQWVLDNTGWNAELPATAIGKDAAVDCP